METYIALLRGINVSGQKMIKMEELKKILGALDFSDISTYIQSGNIIFSSSEKNQDKLTDEISGTIFRHWGFRVPVVIRTRKELESISKTNPFTEMLSDAADKLHVTFLSETPDTASVNKLMEYQFLPDKFQLKGKEIYLYCPGGYGRTKLTNQFLKAN